MYLPEVEKKKKKVSGVNFLEDSNSCTSAIVLAKGYRRCYNSGEFVLYNSLFPDKI